jgi:predicted CXXCH cytochrome family protein
VKSICRQLLAVPVMTLLMTGGLWLPECLGEGGSFSYGSLEGKNEPCLSCHGDTRKVKAAALINKAQYEQTTHARIGCPSCHNEVSNTHPDGVKSPKADCRECHVDINAEYSRSNHAAKAYCSGCHNPHRVETPSEISGAEINRICSGCHDQYRMKSSHAEWLPQADLHLDMLPCITCHTESRNYAIKLYLVKPQGISRYGKSQLATWQELGAMAKGSKIISLIDLNDDNYVSIAELRLFNSDPAHTNLRLQGMMIPEKVTHNFRVLDNRRDCTFCHASGPGAMQKSFLALPEQNGTYSRIVVEQGAVLDALYGTPDFYMTGATRNATLNRIGMVIIAGGMVLPIGHGTLRFLTRKNRKGKGNQP